MLGQQFYQLYMNLQQISNEMFSNIQQSVLSNNKYLFKKGAFFFTFYYLIEGTVNIKIKETSMNVSGPIIIGDYQIQRKIQYRVSTVLTLTKCTFKQISIAYYPQLHNQSADLEKALQKFSITNKILKYWLHKLFVVSHHKINEVVGNEKSIGVIMSGQFKIDKYISIMNKKKEICLLRKFQICLLGPTELFQGKVICETSNGKIALLYQNYVEQLSKDFDQFSKIIHVNQSKKYFHNSLSQNIANKCKKKNNFLNNFLPAKFENLFNKQKNSGRQSLIPHTMRKSNINDQKKLPNKNQIFRISNSIDKFLHKPSLQTNIKLSPRGKNSLNSKSLHFQTNLSKQNRRHLKYLLQKQLQKQLPLKIKKKKLIHYHRSNIMNTQPREHRQSIIPSFYLLSPQVKNQTRITQINQ